MNPITSATLATAASLFFSAFCCGTEWGNLEGHFVYQGDPPVPKKLTIKMDGKAFGALGLSDESLLVSKNGGIANVLVFAVTAGVEIHPDLKKEIPKKRILDFTDGHLVPRICPIWVGHQKLSFTNSTGVGASFQCMPELDGNVNTIMSPQGRFDMAFRHSYSAPVEVTSVIHPWEKGFVVPRENPYITASDENGTFRIDKLPTGKVEFQVWHERTGPMVTNNWPEGRFTLRIKPGENHLGKIKIEPKLFSEKNNAR